MLEAIDAAVLVRVRAAERKGGFEAGGLGRGGGVERSGIEPAAGVGWWWVGYGASLGLFMGEGRRFTVEVDCRAGCRVTVCSWNFSGGSQDRWRECFFFPTSSGPWLGEVITGSRGRGVGEDVSMEVGESLE